MVGQRNSLPGQAIKLHQQSWPMSRQRRGQVPSHLTTANKLRDQSAAQSEMYGGRLFRNFGLPVLAAGCIVLSAVLAADISKGGEETLLGRVPDELKRLTLGSTTKPAEYLAMLKSFGKNMHKFRLPPDAELGMFETSEYDEKSVIGLAESWVDDVLSEEARENSAKQVEGQDVKKMTLGEALDALIDSVYSGPGLRDNHSTDECRCALVSNKRLGTAIWEEYADIAVTRIVSGAVSAETTARQLEMVVATAAKAGALGVISVIISRAEQDNIGVDLAAFNNYAINWAITNGHVGVVEFLFGKWEGDTKNKFGYRKIDPAVSGNSPIICAIANGHVEVVKLIFGKRESGAENSHWYRRINPAAQNNKGILGAIADGKIGMVAYLLQKKEEDMEHTTHGYWAIDPAADNKKGIKAAFENGYPEMVEFLFAKQRARFDLYEGIKLELE